MYLGQCLTPHFDTFKPTGKMNQVSKLFRLHNPRFPSFFFPLFFFSRETIRTEKDKRENKNSCGRDSDRLADGQGQLYDVKLILRGMKQFGRIYNAYLAGPRSAHSHIHV